MPKLKTHKGAAKRLTTRKSGQVQHRKAFGAHKLEKKSSTRKRRLARPGTLAKGEVRKIRRLI
jgi:large subunit ribosomal protein L35